MFLPSDLWKLLVPDISDMTVTKNAKLTMITISGQKNVNFTGLLVNGRTTLCECFNLHFNFALETFEQIFKVDAARVSNHCADFY